jgi:GNAT superfamily N-acetyltransferase
MMKTFSVQPAQAADVPAILGMIRELAEFEKLGHLVISTEDMLHDALFGEHPSCECLVGMEDGVQVAFALFYHNYSTFLGRKGMYLEDLYVKSAHRSYGYGRDMLVQLARLAQQRNCGRFEWSVLNWNDNAIDFYAGLGAEVLPDWRICRVTGAELAHLAR